MFPSLSAYYHHSKKYSNFLAELEFEYAFAKTDKKRFDLLKKFSEKYLMPFELWILAKDLISKLKLPSDTLQIHALFNFCNDSRINKNFTASRYIVQQENRPIWLSLKSFTFPHSKLDQDLILYEQKATKPIPAKQLERIEKLKLLFWEIKTKDKNVEEWFDALTEAENVQFLKINVEHRLCFNLCDKKLWKLYIKYLKTHDKLEMLTVYSKYCRFFLDDNDMIEKYKAILKKYGYIKVPWKNRFKNEKPCSNPINLKLYYPKIEEDDDDEDDINEEEDDYFLEKIDMKKFKLQNWKFPSPIIRYMISVANPSTLQKFHHSCKYFFIKKPKLFCYKFLCSNFGSQRIKYIHESMDCMLRLFLPFNLKNLYITTALMIYHPNPFIFSRLISNNVIGECTAKYIELIFQCISLKELKMLTGHGNVEYLNLDQSTIVDENEKDLMLEDILKMVPKIKSFQNDQVFTSSNTFKILSEMQFTHKFLKFDIGDIENNFDLNDFSEFITKNAAPYSNFTFTFQNAGDVLPGFKKTIDDCFSETSVNGKPNITLKN